MREYRNERVKDEEAFDSLLDRDIQWKTVSSGFFVLLSNICKTPQELLDDYYERVAIELVFKSAKSFEGLLSLAKWTDQRVRGKILADIIDTMLRADLLKVLADKHLTLMDLFHDTESVDCYRSGTELLVQIPDKQARNAYNLNSRLDFNLRLRNA